MAVLQRLILSVILAIGLAIGSFPAGSYAVSSKDLLRQGAEAHAQQDYSTALEQFTAAIDMEPSAAAYSNRCLTYLNLQNPQQAELDCDRAIQLNPTHPEALLNQGLVWLQLSQPQKAVAVYDALLTLKPADYRAHYNRGLAYFDLQQYREAIVNYGSALREVLDSQIQANIYTDRGLAQLMLKNAQGAIGDFSQAIQLNSANARAFYNRGCALHQQGNLTRAVEDFTAVIALAPESAEAYLSRGLIHQQQGETQSAVADLQQAAYRFSEQNNLAAYRFTLSLLNEIRSPDIVFG